MYYSTIKLDWRQPHTTCSSLAKFEILAFCRPWEIASTKTALLISHPTTHPLQGYWLSLKCQSLSCAEVSSVLKMQRSNGCKKLTHTHTLYCTVLIMIHNAWYTTLHITLVRYAISTAAKFHKSILQLHPWHDHHDCNQLVLTKAHTFWYASELHMEAYCWDERRDSKLPAAEHQPRRLQQW